MFILSGLTDWVPLSIKQKIITGRYIDMGDLVDLNRPPRDEICRLAIQKGMDGAPSLVHLPSRRKVFTHIASTAMGGRMYKAVYLEAHPSDVNTYTMLTFENEVCNLARQGLDWLQYDEEFRRGKEIMGYPWNAYVRRS